MKWIFFIALAIESLVACAGKTRVKPGTYDDGYRMIFDRSSTSQGQHTFNADGSYEFIHYTTWQSTRRIFSYVTLRGAWKQQGNELRLSTSRITHKTSYSEGNFDTLLPTPAISRPWVLKNVTDTSFSVADSFDIPGFDSRRDIPGALFVRISKPDISVGVILDTVFANTIRPGRYDDGSDRDTGGVFYRRRHAFWSDGSYYLVTMTTLQSTKELVAQQVILGSWKKDGSIIQIAYRESSFQNALGGASPDSVFSPPILSPRYVLKNLTDTSFALVDSVGAVTNYIKEPELFR